MEKLSIKDAAEHFKISKEAIHNRIRRGSLDCVIDQGIKYVVLGSKVKDVPSDTKYYDYIEKENALLKEKIATLESETKTMRELREQSLIDERIKIEQIYKERDMQLRNVLQVVATQLITTKNVDAVIDNAITAEILESPKKSKSKKKEKAKKDEKSLVSLKKFLKLKDYKAKKLDKVRKRFESVAGDDSRLEVHDGKIYLDTHRFDYGDLLK